MFSRGLEMQHWAGLKQLFVCRQPTLGLPVGVAGWVFFLILGKVSVLHGALPFSIVLFFIIKFMVLAQFLWLIYYEVEMSVRLYANQHHEEILFNPTLGGVGGKKLSYPGEWG